MLPKHRITLHPVKNLFTTLLMMFALLGLANPVSSKELYLAIQPIMPKQQLETFYQPLARFLSDATGHNIRIHAHHNFVSYWEAMRKRTRFDLVLDPAHFTAYRINKFQYDVLAKIRDTLSFSLVTYEDVLLFDTTELIGKQVATPSSPSMSGVQLARLFPNPLRQPRVVNTDTFSDALIKLQEGRVTAALVPTPVISGNTSVNTVVTTPPTPHLAFSASAAVDAITRQRIQKALLTLHETPDGQALLQRLNLSGFEKATNAQYKPFASLLQDVWGY